MTTCMHAKVHEEFFCFTLLAGAPSLGKFPYSINVLPTKRCLFLITLVWSPYVYSPWVRAFSGEPLFQATLDKDQPYPTPPFLHGTRL